MANPVLERRNARARQRGWSSYAQARRWLPRFRDDPEGTAWYLAQRISPLTPEETGRPNSMLSKPVDLIVNGAGGGGKSNQPIHYSPLWERLGTGPDGSMWEARLVRAAVDGMRG